MPDPRARQTLGQLAEEVRSKNAGPFWITLDVFLRTAEDYDLVVGAGILTQERIGELYGIGPASVRIPGAGNPGGQDLVPAPGGGRQHQ